MRRSPDHDFLRDRACQLAIVRQYGHLHMRLQLKIKLRNFIELTGEFIRIWLIKCGTGRWCGFPGED